MSFHSLKINKLILQEAGTYNIQYYRPYVVNVQKDAIYKLQNRVETVMETSTIIQPDMLAGLGESIITPQAAPQAVVAIPGGWSNKRLRFVLEIEIVNNLGITTIYYVQGFTDYCGVSPSGHLDPNMVFYINSLFELTRMTVKTNLGYQISDVLKNSSHLLVTPKFLDPSNSNSLYSVRPSDLFTYMQTQMAGSGYLGYNSFDASVGYDIGNLSSTHAQAILGNRAPTDVYDTRLLTLDGEKTISSNRKNNSPMSYLSTVLTEGLRGHLSNSNFISPLTNGIETTRNSLKTDEVQVNESPLIRALSNQSYTNMSNISSVFSLAQLAKLDSNLPNVTNYLALDINARAQLHQTGFTCEWNGSDYDTQIAASVSSSIPSIMANCLISYMHFRSTNHSLDGQPNTVIINAKSLSNTKLVHMYDLFKSRLEREIIYDFTYGLQIKYTLDVSCDMFGETYITISTQNNPETVYVVPSFCDSVVSPVMNVDPNVIFNNSSGIGVLLDTVVSVSREMKGSNNTAVSSNYEI